MTRAQADPPTAYKERVGGMRADGLESTMLGDNIEQRRTNLDRMSDSLGMFATIRIPGGRDLSVG